MKLWKFNPVTGFWRMERSCSAETAQQWLEIFRKDDPSAYFALSRSIPKFNPTKGKK